MSIKQSENLIPIEELFKGNSKYYVMLSPDGKYISWLNKRRIFIQNLETKEIKQLNDSDITYLGYSWVNNKNLIYSIDKTGSENLQLYLINIDKTEKELTSDKFRSKLVDVLLEDPDHILIETNKRDINFSDIYRLNINTLEMEMIGENNGNIILWTTDRAGKLRIAYTMNKLKREILYRETESDNWEIIESHDFRDDMIPIEFDYDSNILYVTSNIGRERRAVYEYNLKEKKLGKLVFEHDKVDFLVINMIKNYFSKLLFSTKSKKLIGVGLVVDKWEYFYFIEKYQKLQELVDRELPNKINRITYSKDEKYAIINSSSSNTIANYYYFNVKEKKIEKLFSMQPKLEKYKFAEMKAVEFKNREGLTIPSLLTLPVDSDGKNLPMIVIPHGGPWMRDYIYFKADIQYYANRGFAVLLINFRYSIGYGKKLYLEGFNGWGIKSQDDITDGTLWAIDQGIADPNKIIIRGGSYGAISTLQGLVRAPELYQLGIAGAGTYDLFALMKDMVAWFSLEKETLYEVIGDPEKDKELFIEGSTLYNIDNIKKPVMIIASINDIRTKESESSRLVEALKKREIPVEYVINGGGHMHVSQSDIVYNKKQIEKFINKYLFNK